MSNSFKKYGLNYNRLFYQSENTNITFTDENINQILKLITLYTFDYCISLGERCTSAISLYNIGYRTISGPFDYIISKISGINNILFNDKNFEKTINISIDSKDHNNNQYFYFLHHNKKEKETKDEYKIRLIDTFNSKLNNLFNLINQNKRLLFVHSDRYINVDLESQIQLFIENLHNINYYNFRILLIIPDKIKADDFLCKQIKYKFHFYGNKEYNGTD